MEISSVHRLAPPLPLDALAKIIQYQDVPKPQRYFSSARLVSKIWRQACQRALILRINEASKLSYKILRFMNHRFIQQFGSQLRHVHYSIMDQSIESTLNFCPHLHTFHAMDLTAYQLEYVVKTQPQLTKLSFYAENYRYDHHFHLPAQLKKLCITRCSGVFYDWLEAHCPQNLETLKVRFPENKCYPHKLPQQLKKFSIQTSEIRGGQLTLPPKLENLRLDLQGCRFSGDEIHPIPTTLKKLMLHICYLPDSFEIPWHVQQVKLIIYCRKDQNPIFHDKLVHLWFTSEENGPITHLPTRLKRLRLQLKTSVISPLPNSLKHLVLQASVNAINHFPSKLKSLEIESDMVTELPALPATLRRLTVNCRHLREMILPDGIETLYLNNWWYPIHIPRLPFFLRSFHLGASAIEVLPDLSYLPYLVDIHVDGCLNLHIISTLPPNLKNMWLENLPTLTCLPPIAPETLQQLQVRNCPIKKLPRFSEKLHTLSLSQTQVGITDLHQVPLHVNIYAPGWLEFYHKWGVARALGTILGKRNGDAS